MISKTQAEASCANLLKHGYVSDFVRENKVDEKYVMQLSYALNSFIPLVVGMITECKTKLIHSTARKLRKNNVLRDRLKEVMPDENNEFATHLMDLLIAFIADAHDFVPGIL